jgi:hypothetical protein
MKDIVDAARSPNGFGASAAQPVRDSLLTGKLTGNFADSTNIHQLIRDRALVLGLHAQHGLATQLHVERPQHRL